MFSKYQELIKEKIDIDNKLRKFLEKNQEKLQKGFFSLFKDIFKKYSKLESISWTGYTPYFNDGDTCYFRSTHEYPTITYDEEEYEEGWTEDEDEKKTCFKEVLDILNQIQDSTMEDLLGDHVRIDITREGIEIHDYSSHD